MTQGIWASLRGARFVADLHPRADCETVRATATTAPCDVYADADSDPWEAYFEPIYGLRAADIRGGNQTTELDCAAALAQHLPDTNGVYPRTMAQAASYRARNAALVSEWIRIRTTFITRRSWSGGGSRAPASAAVRQRRPSSACTSAAPTSSSRRRCRRSGIRR